MYVQSKFKSISQTVRLIIGLDGNKMKLHSSPFYNFLFEKGSHSEAEV